MKIIILALFLFAKYSFSSSYSVYSSMVENGRKRHFLAKQSHFFHFQVYLYLSSCSSNATATIYFPTYMIMILWENILGHLVVTHSFISNPETFHKFVRNGPVFIHKLGILTNEKFSCYIFLIFSLKILLYLVKFLVFHS